MPPINLPYLFKHPEHGTFRAVTSMLIAPPIFQIREYWPVDDAAEAFVRSLRQAGPPSVMMAPLEHWSRDEEPVLGDAF